MYNGRTKSPEDCRAPIVIIKTAAALIITGQFEYFGDTDINGVPFGGACLHREQKQKPAQTNRVHHPVDNASRPHSASAASISLLAKFAFSLFKRDSKTAFA